MCNWPWLYIYIWMHTALCFIDTDKNQIRSRISFIKKFNTVTYIVLSGSVFICITTVFHQKNITKPLVLTLTSLSTPTIINQHWPTLFSDETLCQKLPSKPRICYQAPRIPGKILTRAHIKLPCLP